MISLIKTYRRSLLFALLCLLTTNTFAEGTKSLMPNSNSKGRLEVYYNFSEFAWYNGDYVCDSDHRLHITVNSTDEMIYFGFGDIRNGSGSLKTDLTYRLYSPDGSIVGSGFITNSGSGHINNHTEAINGPNTINPNGYNSLSHNPDKTGDYYIVFHYSGSGSSERREFTYFDITVADVNNNAIDGRVWSRAWQFTTTKGTTNLWENSFYGKLYVYADDGVVTSIDFNGMNPYVFSLSCNRTGCVNTGNFINDRKSIKDFGGTKYTYPQYKIFLNDPDTVCFPTGSFGTYTRPVSVSGCPPNNYCVNVEVDNAGSVEVLLNLNGIPNYQPNTEDIILISDVVSGANCINWNGRNGLGNRVESGTSIINVITYINGITHLPLNDVEYNDNGYIVRIVRPATKDSIPKLFWDDTNLSSSDSNGTSNLSGCDNSNGCHTWKCKTCLYPPSTPTSSIGEKATINTWWYASGIDTTFTSDHSYIHIPDTTIKHVSCYDAKNGSIVLHTRGGVSPYTYSIDGGAFVADSSFPELSGGIYTIISKDQNGCSDTLVVNIDEPDVISASFTLDDAICNSPTGAANIIASDGIINSSSFQYKWSHYSLLTDSFATKLSHGDYTVTITNSILCDTVYSFTIDSVYRPILDSVTTTSDTCNNNIGSAAITFIGGAGLAPYRYLWSTNIQFNDTVSTDSTSSGLADGDYYLLIVDSLECLSAEKVTIDEYETNFDAIINTINDTCSFGVGRAYIDSISGDKFAPLSYQWAVSPIETDSFVSGLTDTTYSVITTDRYGCSDTAEFSVGNYDSEITPYVSTTPDTCESNVGKAYIDSIGGDKFSPYTYEWLLSSLLTDTSVGGLTDSIYILKTWDKYGCFDTVSFSVGNYDSEITPYVSTTPDTCESNVGKAYIDSIGGDKFSPYTYEWLLSSLLTDTSVGGLTDSIYILKTWDRYGCSDSVSFNLGNYNSIITPHISTIPDTCEGNVGKAIIDSISGEGRAPYSYKWYTSTIQTDSFVIGLSSDTSYQLIVTDKHQCKDTLTILTPSPYSSTITTTTNHIKDTCAFGVGRATISVSGGEGKPPYSYSWSSSPELTDTISSDTNAIKLSTDTTYYIIVKDKHKCQTIDTIDITNYETTITDTLTSTNDTCGYHGGTAKATIIGGDNKSPYKYIWSNDSLQSNILDTNAIGKGFTDSTYYVFIYDRYGCHTMDTITLTNVYPPIIYDTIITNDTCENNLGKIETFPPSSGTSPFVYDWNTGDTLPDLIDLSEGNFRLIIEDENTCIDTMDFEIKNIKPNIIDSIYTINDTCTANTGRVYIITDSTTYFDYKFTWTDSLTQQIVSQNDSATELDSGYYKIHIIDKYACTADSIIFIDETPSSIKSQIKKINVDTCSFGVGRSYAIADSGYAPYEYKWASYSDTSIIISTDSIITGYHDSLYILKITDKYGCHNYDTIIDTLKMGNYIPKIIDSIYTESDTCIGNTGKIITLVDSTTYGYKFTWTDSLTHQTISVYDSVSGLNSGYYKIHIIDTFRCTVDSMIYINKVPSAISSITKEINKDTCAFGIGRYYVSASNGKADYNYRWSPQSNSNISLSTDSIITGGYSGNTYLTTITDYYGCIKTDSIFVENIPTILDIQSESFKDTCGLGTGKSVIDIFGGTTPYRFIWSDNNLTSNDAERTGLYQGNYTISISDKHNCSSLISVEIETICRPIIPNIITPNGDDYNEKFDIHLLEHYKNNQLVIFNRWGVKIRDYVNYSYSDSWDGTDKDGNPVNDGVYYYILYLRDGKPITGTVTVKH